MKQLKKKQFVFNTVVFLILIGLSTNAQSGDKQDTYSGNSFTGESLFKNASFIMDFSYIYRNVTDEQLSSFQVPMFVEPSTIKYPNGGLKLNYGELAANPKIDNNFELFFDFLFNQDDFKIDEMYANSTNLPYGFRFKVGRFLSSFGWHNQFHKHQWNFLDAPLVQTVFFGDKGLLEDAIQMGWEVPVDFYMFIGFEIANGENLQSFGTESFGATDLGVKKSKNPNLYTFIIDSNIDLSNLSIIWGLSLAGGKGRIKGNLETNSGSGIYGDTVLGGGNLGFKYNFDRFTYVEWQNEMIYRSIDGAYFQGFPSIGTTIGKITKKQIGGYSQLIFKPFEYWRMGGRAEVLQSKATIDMKPVSSPKIMTKYSGMIDLNPTEYTQIRLQYNYNKQYYDENDKLVDVREIILQFNFAFGPHGAHSI
jgi:hypothetical protein